MKKCKLDRVQLRKERLEKEKEESYVFEDKNVLVEDTNVVEDKSKDCVVEKKNKRKYKKKEVKKD